MPYGFWTRNRPHLGPRPDPSPHTASMWSGESWVPQEAEISNQALISYSETPQLGDDMSVSW